MLAFIFYIVLFLQTAGQSPDIPAPDYLVRNYTVADGLPVNAINDIVQDQNGYLWFSTLDGLVRFDGYDFVTFNSANSNGIYNDRIAGVMKASTGVLWMVSETGEISRYDGSTFRTFDTSDGMTGDVVRIKEDQQQTIWVSTTEGVFYLEVTSEFFLPVQQPLFKTDTRGLETTIQNGVIGVNHNGLIMWTPGHGTDPDGEAVTLLNPEDFPIPVINIMTISPIDENTFWVMGGGGFFLIENGTIHHEFTYTDGDPELMVWDVKKTDENQFIFTTTHGFYEVNTAEGVISKLPYQMNYHVTRSNLALEGKQGELILITDKEVIIDGESIFQTEEIQAGFVDHEGAIWVASVTQGLFQIRRSRISNITVTDNFPIENIYPILQTADGSVWAGSFWRGLFRFLHDETTHWDQTNSNFVNSQIRYLFEDNDGSVYAGLWNEGLWKFNGSDWIRDRSFDEVYGIDQVTIEAMHRDGSGRLLIGMHGEMVVREGDHYRLFRDMDGRGITGVRVIRETSEGLLLLGTNGNGLVVLFGETIRSVITEEQGLASNFIRDIYVQSTDTLWIATQNRGLKRLVLDDHGEVDSVAHISTYDGLISNSLHRIIEDPFENLWISSNSGVMKIPKAELNRYVNGDTNRLTITGFNERDGMVNREANGGVQTAGLLNSDGTIWFPNQKGITIFATSELDETDSTSVAGTIIEHIVLSNSLIHPAGFTEITLPKGERNIRFKFTAPNFLNPARVNFRHRISGIDDGWLYGTPGREATYTNLPPGRHQFEVVSEQENGAISEASVFIIVPYRFHESIWFYLILLTGVVLLGYGGHRYRLNALHQRELMLVQRVDEQTEELKRAAEEKSRFFTGITHELKTPLSLILGPLDDMLKLHEEKWPDKIAKSLNLMQRNGWRLKKLIDQILDVNRLNTNTLRLTVKPVEIMKLTAQITGQFRSLLEEKQIHLELTGTTPSEPVYLDPESWERILINLVSNAIRFSPKDGKIIITLTEHPESVVVSIRDYGTGIPKEHQERVFDYLYQVEGDRSSGGTGIGLFLVSGLINRMGGTIRLKSDPGEGSEFIITLKKGSDHFNESDIIQKDAPVDVHELDVMQAIKTPEPKIASMIQSVETERILVVEDDHDFRSYLSSILSVRYSVNLAAEGREALESAREESFDLVISDIMMPGMDGYELAEELRKTRTYRSLPFIFLSAKDQDVDKEKGLSTGADIYLTKPIRSSLLLSQVESVLRRERILKEKMPEPADKQPQGLKSEIRTLVYRQLANPGLNTETLAEALFMSRSKLYREWKKVSDQTLNEYLTSVRLKEARELIELKGFSVQDAARAVGYPDPNYFSTSFKKMFGISPSELKSGE